MIAIIGSGNVAVHLYKALSDNVPTLLINPHTLEGLPKDADIILIAVADKAIEEVAGKIKNKNSVIAHTSGSIPMDVLKNVGKNIGVFYPLQTFSKGREINYKEIPLFLEGNSSETIFKLKKLGSLFSDNIYEADSAKRKKLHLASVFACNFTNALASVSEKLLENTGYDFKVLQPLMKETIQKLETLSPGEAQTGPAVRKDEKVIEDHKKMLEDQPDLKLLYSIFSDYIKQNS